MNSVILDEYFRPGALDPRLHWFNPPGNWSLRQDRPGLVVEPAAQTDFWQQTHYGFRADNGHFLSMPVQGDFTISTRVTFRPVHQYDQAGLMIRYQATSWIKTSVEHELDGPPQLGVVVTNVGYSDWSLQDLPFPKLAICLRLCRHGSDVMVQFCEPGQNRWRVMRVTHWPVPDDLPVEAGLYSCCPKGSGFEAEFAHLRIVAGSDDGLAVNSEFSLASESPA